jgi:hypothetical protein
VDPTATEAGVFHSTLLMFSYHAGTQVPSLLAPYRQHNLIPAHDYQTDQI